MAKNNKEYVGVKNNIIMDVISNPANKNADYDYFEIPSISEIFDKYKIYCRNNEGPFSSEILHTEDWAIAKAYGVKLSNEELGDNDQDSCYAYKVKSIIGQDIPVISKFKDRVIGNLLWAQANCVRDYNYNIRETQIQNGEYDEDLINNLKAARKKDAKKFDDVIQFIDSEFKVVENKGGKNGTV